jgi:hypothetical protein
MCPLVDRQLQLKYLDGNEKLTERLGRVTFDIESPMAILIYSEKTTTACTGALYDNLRKLFRHDISRAAVSPP